MRWLLLLIPVAGLLIGCGSDMPKASCDEVRVGVPITNEIADYGCEPSTAHGYSSSWWLRQECKSGRVFVTVNNFYGYKGGIWQDGANPATAAFTEAQAAC